MTHEFKISPINTAQQLYIVESCESDEPHETGYVLILQNRTILIDLADHRVLPLLQRFHVPEILILTHKHARKDEAFFERVFDTKIYLAAEDLVYSSEKTDPELAKRYRNPFKCPDLESLGFTFKRVEGRTLVIHPEVPVYFLRNSALTQMPDSRSELIF